MERIAYLSPTERQSVENWVADLEPLKERYPVLNQVDIVIEGGVGTRRTMPHIARRFFPNSLYFGTDLSQMLAGSRRRQRGQIDDDALERALRTNEHPDLGMEGAILLADCFDYALVQDIVRKTGKKVPFLASYNAVPALFDRKMNPTESKESGDLHAMDATLDATPYSGQLHIINDAYIWDEGPTDRIRERYFDLETAAQQRGMTTERVDCGLLVLKAA